MKSNGKKLLGATFSLLLSAAMLATSTYAWFTMNKEVKVEGMQMQVKTSSNLLISPTNVDDSTYTKSLTTEKLVLLEPTSTINGTDFFYTLDGAADGHKISGPDAQNPYNEYNESDSLTVVDTYANKTKYDSDFNNEYNISTANPTTLSSFQTAYGYFDYTFYLKAVNNVDNRQIVMNKCNLLYNNEVITDKAWRIGIFVQETAAETEPTSIGTLVSIISPAGAKYQTSGKAVNSTTTVDTVSNAGNDVIVDSDIDKETKYYKVVMRVWIEGEDTTCTTETYGLLTENYNLEFRFSIDENAEPVNKIASATT